MFYFLAFLFVASVAAKQCTNFTVPVEISARNGVFNVPVPATNVEATTFTQSYISIMNGTNYTMEVLTDYQTVTGTYDISAQFCMPDTMSGSSPAVQVLTHGIGFDKTYWDLPYNDFMYSYVDVAVDQYGFCTLSYDRLGIGNSSHGDPLNVIQAAAEISAMYQLNTMLRDGSLPNVPQAFTKIVNVGHSYGSQQSYQLATMYPNATDAIILTGFSFNGSYAPATIGSFNSKIASLNQPLRFGNISAATVQQLLQQYMSAGSTLESIASSLEITMDEITQYLTTTDILDLISGYDAMPPMAPQNLPAGYMTWTDAGVNQLNFFAPPYFDPAIVPWAESHKQPYTIGEILTLGGAPAVSPFAGPVQIFTGQQDAIYCGGDCLNTAGIEPPVASIPAAAQMYFPSAKSFEAYIQPATGHGINLHYNSTSANAVIQEYLIAQGLASA